MVTTDQPTSRQCRPSFRQNKVTLLVGFRKVGAGVCYQGRLGADREVGSITGDSWVARVSGPRSPVVACGPA
jgi:hypothetical protein